jgi:hypothetical protein
LSFALSAGGGNYARTAQAGELKPEDRNAAGALNYNRIAGRDVADRNQCVPCGHRGAGKRSSLLVGEMFRNMDHRAFVHHGIFPQHPVGRSSAKGGIRRPGTRSAGDPRRHEDGGYAVAGAHPRNARAHLGHVTGAVGERNQSGLDGRPDPSLDGQQVAVIERGRFDPDQNLAGAGCGFGPVDQGQTAGTGVVLNLVCFHFDLCGSFLSCHGPKPPESRTDYRTIAPVQSRRAPAGLSPADRCGLKWSVNRM